VWADWRGCERTLLKAKTAQALPTELTSRADHAANFLIENLPGHHGLAVQLFCWSRQTCCVGFGGDGDRRGRRAGSLGSRRLGWPGAETGRRASPVVVPGPGWPDVPAPTGRRPCCRGRAGRGGRVRGAAGQPADRRHRCGPVPPGQSLAGGLYPPMWTAQLSGVIGALPLVAAAATLFRRLRLAAALAVAALLKVSLESVAKMFVQRGRPAETVSEVILRGKAAAHGLSFPSGHASVPRWKFVRYILPVSRGSLRRSWSRRMAWGLRSSSRSRCGCRLRGLGRFCARRGGSSGR
jgi:hypothetical protein